MKKGSHYNLAIADLIMGILFIFILILVKFMLDYQDKKDDLSKPLFERNNILDNIAKELKEKHNIIVDIDKKNGILKLNDVHYFDEGQYELNQIGKKELKIIRNIIFEKIVCYSHLKSHGTSQKWPMDKEGRTNLNQWINYCEDEQPDKYALMDTILIEGHADSKPIPENGNLWKKGIKTNLDLATKRSIKAFEYLTNYQEATIQQIESGNYLYALENKQEKALFAVSSYGNLRRHQNRHKYGIINIIDRHISLDEAQAGDRRIDIRFIMAQPDDIAQSLSQQINNKESVHE